MKVSIALCTFNGEKFIEEQLHTLINQTHLPDEIVISDDGSIDNTVQIIQKIENKTTIPFVYFKHEKLGVFKNFSQTISQCSGDIIFPCDQDDIWKLDKIEKHLNVHHKDEKIKLVYSNADVVNNTQDHYLYPLWDVKSICNQKHPYASLSNLVYKGKSIAGCCMSFKKDFYDTILPIPDDVYHDDWIASCASILGQIQGISESLIYYRQHGNNVVGTVRGSKLSYWKSLLTNPKFYHESDSYIYQRHAKVFNGLMHNPNLDKYVDKKALTQVLRLYKARSHYQIKKISFVMNDLIQCYQKQDYKFLNGILTLVKDFYNLFYIKLFQH